MSSKDIAPIEEISVSAQLTENGLKAGAKSRAFAALDRLLGSTIDLAGAPIEGLRDRLRARNENREELIRATGRLALERLGQDPTLSASIIDDQVSEATRRAENKEAVAVEFLEELRSEPGPDHDSDEHIDSDWLNMFSSHAENASSDHLRTLWSRILAGQVRSPGAFSLSTLRFVSELDKPIAELFQKHLGSIVLGGFLLKPKDLKGDALIEYTVLEEVGLLIEVNGLLGSDIVNGPDGYTYQVQGNLILRMKLSKDSRINIIKITRVGREIASILPRSSDEKVLIDIFEHLEEDVVEADINLITARLPDGSVNFVMMKKLK